MIPKLPQPYIETPAIDAEVFLRDQSPWVLIDVRAPVEFAQGHIPGGISCPVLNDEERHQVGLTYKQQGQQAAIDLGCALVWHDRAVRAREWIERAQGFCDQRGTGSLKLLVSCWRGGLRSQLAASWLAELMPEVVRLNGGYKSLRGLLLNEIAAPHRMHVVSGMTGSGKTLLLHQLMNDAGFERSRIIDLEGLARHRGSSFGHGVGVDGQRIAQPSQQYFENELGILLHQEAKGPLVVEDESTLIGHVSIPQEFRNQMHAAPVVVLEASLDERVAITFQEYVVEPLERGCDVDALWKVLAENIAALERRFGGKDTAAALGFLEGGRGSPRLLSQQEAWIRILLDRYYDRAYAKSLQLAERNVVFRGERRACHEFLSSQI